MFYYKINSSSLGSGSIQPEFNHKFMTSFNTHLRKESCQRLQNRWQFFWVKLDVVNAVNEQRHERKIKHENISRFLRALKKSDTLLAEFDEELWHATVNRVIVKFEHEIAFLFKDGTELPWTIYMNNELSNRYNPKPLST
jgi:hypothetical protein